MVQFFWIDTNHNYVYLNGYTSVAKNPNAVTQSMDYAMAIGDDEEKFKEAFEKNVLPHLSGTETYKKYYGDKCDENTKNS